MSKIGVGKEIVTYCSKCKLDLAHVIHVMKDETTPLKVECRTCGSIHSFKEKKAPATKKKTTRTRVSSAQKQENAWAAGLKKSEGEPVKYSPRTKFEIGQVVDHPTFGQGVVDRLLDANKIEVIFQTATRVLIHAK